MVLKNNSVIDLENLPAIVLEIDHSGVCRAANSEAIAVLGQSVGDLVGRRVEDLFVEPSVRTELSVATTTVLANGTPIDLVVSIPDPNGAPSAYVLRSTRLANGLLLFGLPVPRRSVDESRQLATADARLRAFLEFCPSLAWLKNSDGQYLLINDAYARQFGLDTTAIFGRRDSDIFTPEVAAILVANDQTVLASNAALTVVETTTNPTNGRVQTWMTYKFPHADPIAGPCVGGFAVDITEQQRYVEERQQQQKALLQAQKLESLGVLAGGIAHDFNNILTAILGYASFARMDVKNARAVDDALTQIETGARRAADLCKQMLAYSGKGQFVVKPVDMNSLVEEMAQLLQAAVSKKVVLRFNLTRPLAAVKCDATQIRQVVMNLITNASDAIGDRSGVVTITTGVLNADQKYLDEVTLSSQLRPGKFVYVEVSDTGSGMTPAIQAKIFEPFFSTKFTGRGLGLSAVQGIVRGHSGAIKVYSELDKGSTFKILLPASSETAILTTPPPAVRVRGNGRRVLVVDDEEDIRVFARKVLESVGFVVELATDGRAAVELFRPHPNAFDLVLLDLTMPHWDGATAFRELRRVRADIPVLLTSGYSVDAATTGFEGKGLAGFIRKPFTIQELLEAVATAVDKGTQPEATTP